MSARNRRRHDVSMSLRRLSIVLVLAAVSSVALVGCAPAVSGIHPGQATSGSHPSVKPTRKPVVPVLNTTTPAPRLDIPCNTLVPQADVTAYQGAGVTLVQPALLAAGDLADPNSLLPSADYIRETGGIQCIWSAGPVDNYLAIDQPVPALLEITVQFDAASTWPIVAQDIGAVGNEGGDCDVDDPGNICQTEDLVGTSTWIEIYSRHGAGSGDISKVESDAVAAVNAGGTPATLPSPQAGTTKLGTSCTALLATDAVASAVGTTVAVTASTPDQGQTDYALQNWVASQNLLKDHPCFYKAGATVQAKLAWLPGGAWAWNENKTQTLANGPLQTLHVAGEQSGDTAAIRCAASDSSCTVDLVLGGNWIEASVPATSTAANKRTAATQIAADIVGTLG
jgi:hypothetical protein